MRLIDADALKQKYFGRRGGLIHTSDIDNAPTIDAVDVIKCKDCKYYKPSAVASRKMCFRKDVDGVQVCCDFQPDDFCSHGERRKYETD